MERDKALNKAAKLKAMMESAAQVGNEKEAEAFAGMVNRLMLRHELSEAEINSVSTEEPIEEVEVDRNVHGLGIKRSRVAWTELLAAIVAEAHLCRNLVMPGTNRVWFVGTKRHADVAAYMYGTMARLLDRMATSAYNRYCKRVYERDGSMRAARGYRQSFIVGFLGRLKQRYDDERKGAVHEAPQGESLAVIRLSGVLTRVDEFMKGKKELPGTNFRRDQKHVAGYREGIKAADALKLQANAIESQGGHKALTEGANA